MSEIDKLEGQTQKFAEACYDQNSINELIDALVQTADKTDCEWGISADEWKIAIQAALKDKIYDRTIEQQTCNRCGYVFYPKNGKLPQTCPNPKCRSPYWNKPSHVRGIINHGTAQVKISG